MYPAKSQHCLGVALVRGNLVLFGGEPEPLVRNGVVFRHTFPLSVHVAQHAASVGVATPGGKGGLVCHTPMVAVARPLGRKRAVEMALTGDTIDAATALEWGLVNRVVPPADLDEATIDLLGRATRGSRYAKGIGKQTLYAQMDMAVDDAYELAMDVMATNAARGDGAEWPKAFIEKRRPVWTHTS